MKKAKIIVLEGNDGAGKTTQIDLIKSYFNEKKIKYDFLHFPMYGNNEFSEVIAKFLRGEFGSAEKINPYFAANIYAMDRFLYLDTLNKKLEENDVVLLDRYVFSNVAYQSAKMKNSKEAAKIAQWIIDLEFDFLNLPYPDLNMYLDVPIDVIKERLQNKRSGNDRDYLEGKDDIHEIDLDLQTRVRDTYLTLEDVPNCSIIKTEKNGILLKPEELFNSYKSSIKELIYG